MTSRGAAAERGCILLIDDNPDDRTLVARSLAAEMPELTIEQVGDQESFLRALGLRELRLVITDYALRWSDGLAVLAEVRRRSADMPVIMFTGTGNEEVAAAAMKAGLTDYIVKSSGHFGRLPFAVRAALEQQRQRATLRSTEALLRHAQKMEALGRLAGGIAHDFNNLLTAIRGYAELVAFALPDEHPAAGDAKEIIRASDRAVALTSQLVRFSRREPAPIAVLDMAEVVREVVPMIRRLIGPEVHLVVDAEHGPYPIKADQTQIEQILVNLAVNARDAMTGGGTLTVEVRALDLDDAAAAERGVRDGGYVRLAVRDTGVGMDDETKAHIFEPFYTTKPSGEGTGLGLATVFGIAQGAGGAVSVESVPGEGSCFEILWPAA